MLNKHVAACAAAAAMVLACPGSATAAPTVSVAAEGGPIKGSWSLYPGVAGVHVWGETEKSGSVAVIKIKDTADDKKEACAYIHVTGHQGSGTPNEIHRYCAPGGTKGGVQVLKYSDRLKTVRVQECVDNFWTWEKCDPGAPSHPTRLVYRDP
jgi:hypothetical protein